MIFDTFSYEAFYQYLKVDWDLSDRAIFTLATWLTHDITNWTLQLLLFVVYHFNLFPQYKLQGPGKSTQISLVIFRSLEPTFASSAPSVLQRNGQHRNWFGRP